MREYKTPDICMKVAEPLLGIRVLLLYKAEQARHVSPGTTRDSGVVVIFFAPCRPSTDPS